ncbi:MAG: ABC transporter permease, partial [Vibrio sp.]
MTQSNLKSSEHFNAAPNRHWTKQAPSLFRWCLREIVHGQLWPVVIALSLIIACVFGLSALGDRMDDVIAEQSRNTLTADLIYRSSNPIPEPLLNQTQDLKQSQMVRFTTMAFSDQGMKLSQIHAVDSNYPLQGEFVLSGKATQHKVNPGELWLEPRLMQDLKVNIGDVVSIGDADLKVSGEITTEPGLNFNP